MTEAIDIVFDGPPGPTPGRFVEVENGHGESVSLGEWVERPDGYWVLRFTTADVHNINVASASAVGPAEHFYEELIAAITSARSEQERIRVGLEYHAKLDPLRSQANVTPETVQAAEDFLKYDVFGFEDKDG